MPATFSIGMALGAPTGFIALNLRDAVHGSGYLNWFDLAAISILIGTYALIAGVITASCTIRLRAAFSGSRQLTAAADRYCLFAGLLAGLLNYPALLGLVHWQGTGELTGRLVVIAFSLPVFSAVLAVVMLVH